jgi:hypothetical protein
MNRRKIFIPIALLLVLSGLFAIANSNKWLTPDNAKNELPDAKEELQKLYTIYNKQDTSFNINGMIRLYDKENKDVLKEQTSFSYSKKGKNVFNQIGYLRTFFDDSLVVQLDTVNKYIAVSKIVEGRRVPVQSGLPFEKFMEDTSTFKISATVSEKNKERALTIISELNPEIKSSVIYYDPVTYKIKKAEIEWWKEAMINDQEEANKKIWLTIMEYTYPVSSGTSGPKSIKEIIVWEDGKPKPTKAYEDYQVHVTF